ncbi:MAG: alpha/beta hydrolase [Eubacteriaceae bacterium]|nr:alpha/beta hydrolase [Eubacteriaceae bacterium]
MVKYNIFTTFANGNKFEYVIKGSKKPSIVLINGAGGPLEGWSRIWDHIGGDSKVFAYNRLGIGKSDKPSEPQTGSTMVKSLKALLLDLVIEPPYILVSHSLGGFIADLFARMYPKDVCGVVFIESSTIKDALRNTNRKSESSINNFAEADNVLVTIKQIQEAGPFPDIPIRVISGSKPAFRWFIPKKIRDDRLRNQRELVLLSGKGSVKIASRSGHFPQLTEPHVVIDEINDFVRDLTKTTESDI